MKLKIGLDIGGTKCAISTGVCEGGTIKILSREEFPTAGLSWQQVLDEFAARIEKLINSQLLHSSTPNSSTPPLPTLSSIGISCGGPLDSKRGVIMSPPNLPVEVHSFGNRKSPSQNRLHTRKQHLPVERLRDIVVCTGFETAHDVLARGARRKHDDARRRERRRFANPSRN